MSEPLVVKTAVLWHLRECMASLYNVDQHAQERTLTDTIIFTTVADLSNRDLDQLIITSPAIRYLGWLSRVDLQGNKLTSLPDGLWLLTGLRELNLGSNKLEVVPSDIGKLESLQRLFLQNNQIIEIPTQISRLQQLELLDICGNRLDQLPSQIKQISNCVIWLTENEFPSQAQGETTELISLQAISAQVIGNELERHTIQQLPPMLAQRAPFSDPDSAPECSTCSALLFHHELTRIRYETIGNACVPIIYRFCSHACKSHSNTV